MSFERDDIVAFWDRQLAPGSFKDACPNGIQVYGRRDVERLATCVSVSAECFELTLEQKAQMLLVHHGMFWEGSSRVVDPLTGKRLRLLLENEINLVAYHLPVDAHPRLGNNAALARVLDLKEVGHEFAQYKGQPIGCSGRLESPLNLGEIAERLSGSVSGRPRIFGPPGEAVERIGIVSGGGGDIPVVNEALSMGLDAVVTGVVFEQTVMIAREGGVHMIELGHYNSEKLGVRACGDAVADEFGIEVVHLDVPNPV